MRTHSHDAAQWARLFPEEPRLGMSSAPIPARTDSMRGHTHVAFCHHFRLTFTTPLATLCAEYSTVDAHMRPQILVADRLRTECADLTHETRALGARHWLDRFLADNPDVGEPEARAARAQLAQLAEGFLALERSDDFAADWARVCATPQGDDDGLD